VQKKAEILLKEASFLHTLS